MKIKKSSLTTLITEKLTQQSYEKILLLWLGITLMFGILYFLLLIFSPQNGPRSISPDQPLFIKLLDSIYYSIITATSTGYGDIVPQGFSKFLASIQSFTALAIFAIFVTKLVSYKQELALREVHQLIFEDVFHNVREGLYIVRKDCDRFIRHAKENRSMTEEDWEDLTVMYRHIRSLFHKIPQFYGTTDFQTGYYIIDADRESLLHEAVYRTFTRIFEMNNILHQSKINFEKHEDSLIQLKKVIRLIDKITPEWKKESHYKENFNDIISVAESIKKQINYQQNS